jgi:hypothetical protein
MEEGGESSKLRLEMGTTDILRAKRRGILGEVVQLTFGTNSRGPQLSLPSPDGNTISLPVRDRDTPNITGGPV